MVSAETADTFKIV